MALSEAWRQELRDPFERDTAGGSLGAGTTMLIEVAALREGRSVRRGALRMGHVEALMETVGKWPPILVARDQATIIDGHHRLAAARRLGVVAIPAIVFIGDDDAAVLEAITRNVRHGLPLTLTERRDAAKAVLRLHPDWSDARIAIGCGLAAPTVARVREGVSAAGRQGRPDGAGGGPGWSRRLGRDGRRRPVDAARIRQEIMVLLEKQPASSLRTIAAQVGASPETVRSVRRSMQVPGGPCVAASPSEPVANAAQGRSWAADSACSSVVSGPGFVTWFDQTVPDQVEALSYVERIPMSRIYEVADEARRRAAWWASFANMLQARAR